MSPSCVALLSITRKLESMMFLTFLTDNCDSKSLARKSVSNLTDRVLTSWRREKRNTEKVDRAQLDQIEKELAAARQRLGSAKDTLEWFFRFKDLDLDKLSPTEKELLTYELLASYGANRDTFTSKRSTELMDIKALHDVQVEIKVALIRVFEEDGRYSTPGTFCVDLHRRSAVNAKEGKFEIAFYRTSKTDYAVMGFVSAMSKAGEVCPHMHPLQDAFVATKRQEYCSPLCSQIMRNEKKKIAKEEKLKK